MTTNRRAASSTTIVRPVGVGRLSPVRRLGLSLVAAVVVLVAGQAFVAAAQADPVLRARSLSNTTAAPGSTLEYMVEIDNIGDSPADGTGGDPLVLEATFPAGMAPVFAFGFGPWDCSAMTATSQTCTNSSDVIETKRTGGEDQALLRSRLVFVATVDPAASGAMATRFEISGGGAAAAATVDSLEVTAEEPEFGIDVFDGQLSDLLGNPLTQAGDRPDLASTDIDFNVQSNPALPKPPPPVFSFFQAAYPVEGLKNVRVDLPPGLVGDPTSAQQCELADLARPGFASCPVGAQVGTTTVRLNGTGAINNYGPVPVYNMVPPPDAPARFGFNVEGTTVTFTPRLRSGSDYGVSADFANLPTGLPVAGSNVTLWGNPADPAHDRERVCTGQGYPFTGGPTALDPSCVDGDGNPLYVRPDDFGFMRLPTSCVGPVETSVHVDSWVDPGAVNRDGSPDLSDPAWVSDSFISHDPPGYPAPPSEWGSPQGVTGCAAVPFNPQLSVQPTSREADSPTGLVVDLSLPQTDDPHVLSSSDLKKAVVRLPEGMTVNPASADGLAGCSSAQVDLRGENTPARCPDGSKIGTVSVETPLLEEPLAGSVYLASQADNPFGSLLAMYIVVEGPGVVIKLPGRIEADPATGRLTTTFDDQPQLPFSHLHLELFDGPRASLTTPKGCGDYEIAAELTPWARPESPVERSSSFTVDSGCGAAGFDPGFWAAPAGSLAGVFSPFDVHVTRGRGAKELGRINMALPQGLLADLSDVAVCSEAQLATATTKRGVATQGAPGCSAGSQVGTTTVGSGSGPQPFYPRIPGTDVSGRVFLTGPHTDTEFKLPGVSQADYGLAIEVPAVAGPFDLGTVLVRAAIYVDPETAELTVLSDRLPRILEGIPLDVRDVWANINRRDFTVTPTSCEQATVEGDIRAQDGTQALRTSQFKVGGCENLKLKPKLTMRLVGRGQTKSKGHPALRTRLTQGAGESNLRRVRVVLPRDIVLDPANANNAGLLCSFERGRAADCPASSIIGRAKAVSPLLKRPLTGPVYFVQGKRRDKATGNLIRTFPQLLVKLKGEVDINLRAQTNVVDSKLVTTFPTIPDARVKSFQLNLRGGKQKGILLVTRTAKGSIDVCDRPQDVKLAFQGHNQDRLNKTVRIKTPCPTNKPPNKLKLRRRSR